MRIDHKNFYANIVKSEGGVSYYVIQSRGNDEVIYCGQARTQRARQAAVRQPLLRLPLRADAEFALSRSTWSGVGGSGCVFSHRSRALTVGSMPVFLHHEASSPQ